MYEKGVEQNYIKAIKYYQSAAEKENTDALINLGFIYEKGKGVEQSYSKANEYYQSAADKGNA